MSPKRQQGRLAESKVSQATHTAVHAQQVSVAAHSESFFGPIPHPDVLVKYEEKFPGLAERIIRMAEDEQNCRLDAIKQEEKQKEKLLQIAEGESRHAIRSQTVGQWLGFIVSLLCLGMAFWSAYAGWGWQIVACFVGVLTASLVSAFIPQKKPFTEQKASTKSPEE